MSKHNTRNILTHSSTVLRQSLNYPAFTILYYMVLPRQHAPMVDQEMLHDVSIMKDSLESKSPLQVLRRVFGHHGFRPGQEQAIKHLISGEDTIVLIPTGGGKTVTYALPCIMTPGIAIVVSPLIVLMCDQVSRLQGLGVNTCYYNTMQNDSERQNILHNLKQSNCQYQFVFVSPEVVVTDNFQSCLNALNSDGRLSFFIVDEAH